MIGDLRRVERRETNLVGALGDNALAGADAANHESPLAIRGSEGEHAPLEALSTDLDVRHVERVLFPDRS